MAKKKKVYKQESILSEDMRHIFIGAVLASQNALVVSESGLGKTAFVKHPANRVFGEDHVLFMELSPSTTKADVAGYPNPLYMLTPDAQERGIADWVVEGTPLDPRYDLVILDELTRGSSVAFDELIHRMHDETSGRRPTFLATANWLTIDQRNQPVFDRMATIYHYKDNSDGDLDAFFHNADVSTWEFNLPTRAEVEQVRLWTAEYMRLQGDALDELECTDVILNTMQEIIRLAFGTALKTTKPRRLKTWKQLLYALGCYYNGMKQDWDTLPAEVFEVLKFAYPCQNATEQMRWQEIVVGLYNPESSAMDEYLQNAYADFKAVTAKANGDKDVITRELGSRLQNASAEMDAMFGAAQPKLVADAKKKLQDMMKKALRGEKLD